MSQPLISILIPTFNEEEHITGCLESVLAQTYPKVEIIVIDDGSTDSTINLVKKIKGIKLLRQSHLSAGAARNKGARHAKGKILVFIDADMILDPACVTHLTSPIRLKKSLGTFTKDEFVANIQNSWSFGWSRMRGFDGGSMHPANYPDTQPVFRAIDKKTFLKAGGFDTNRGYDDDWSLSQKLGFQATLAPGAIIYHHNPSSLREVFTQASWMAKRQYKFGLLGKIFALFRSSLPISLITSAYLAIKNKSITLIFAKITFDLGLFLGILKSLFHFHPGR